MDDTVTTPSETKSDGKPSVTVVTRIAELEGEDPTELTPPLYAAIDPQALDSLVPSMGSSVSQTAGTVRFTYLGYDVCVGSDGTITVTDPSQSS